MDALTQFAQQLVVLLGLTTQYAFDVMVRQKQLEGIFNLISIAIVLFGIAGIGFLGSVICREIVWTKPPKVTRREKEDDYDFFIRTDKYDKEVSMYESGGLIGYTVGGIFGLLFTMVLTSLIQGAVLQIMNPQYYSILQLMDMLKK